MVSANEFDAAVDMFDDDDDDDLDPMGVHQAARGSGTAGAREMAKTTGGKIQSAANIAYTIGGKANSVVSNVGGLGAKAAMVGAAGAFSAVAGTAVGGAVLTAAAAAAPVTGPIGIALAAIASTISGVSAVKTHLHIKKIEEYYNLYAGVASSDSKAAVLYIIAKKNKKRSRKGLGVVPVLGGTANTFYSIGRAIQKKFNGTKGTHRRSAAKTLWENQLKGCSLAREVCLELLGKKIFISIQHELDGDLVLKKKMRSI